MPTNFSIKRILLFLFYSLCIAILLRITVFGYSNYNQYTCFIGLGITVISTYWIQKEEEFSLSILDKILLIIGPIFFFVNTWSDEDITYNFLQPYSVGTILMLLNLFVFKDLKKFRNAIVLFLIVLGYSKLKYENWQYYRFEDWRDKAVLLHINKENDTINTDIDLAQFNFIDTNQDTIQLSKQKPYTFIITWDEYCKFCKTAFKELDPVLKNYPNVEKYYVYNFKKYQPKSFIDSYNDQSILADKNVVADYNYSFTEHIGILGNPTLLIINNKTNKLIFLGGGFGDFTKNTLIETLDELK